MNTLIISDSLVIKSIFEDAIKEKDISLEFVNSSKKSQSESYMVVFIDDTIKDLKDEIDYIQNNFDYNNLIILESNSCELTSFNNIKKPFLSEDIEKFFLELKEEESSVKISSILDIKEIEKIKSLIKDSEDIDKNGNFIEKVKNRENIKVKNKKAKKLLKDLLKLEKKELKKLLKKSSITIKIKFKEN